MKWLNRIKLLQISKVAIVICLVLSIVLAGFTIYGDQVGNFVITTEEKTAGINIALSEYEDLSHQSNLLAAKGLTSQTNTTLAQIPFDVSDGLGNKNDETFKRYMAYSFYLINNSDRTTDLTLNIQISELKRGVDSAIRVMFIVGNDERGEIFAKSQEDENGVSLNVPEDSPYPTTMFLDRSTVMQQQFPGLGSGETVKFTVVIWVEGWDAQCVDSIMGGSIKLNMNIMAN